MPCEGTGVTTGIEHVLQYPDCWLYGPFSVFVTRQYTDSIRAECIGVHVAAHDDLNSSTMSFYRSSHNAKRISKAGCMVLR